MHHFKKPFWAEGLVLTQQIFQQWEVYWETRQTQQLHTFHPYAWGIIELVLDETALLTGRFRVTHCEAIFPHGQHVVFDAAIGGELCCDLNQNNLDNREIFLCLPFVKFIKGLSGYDVPHDLYGQKAHYEKVADYYDPAREKEIGFTLPNLQLLDNSQPRENVATIKIAEVKRLPHGKYEVNSEFIPALFSLKANPTLMQHIKRMIDLLTAKLHVLMARKMDYQNQQIHWSHAELIHFLLLQLLHQTIPIFENFYSERQIHPYGFYRECIRFLGAVQPFLSQEKPLAIPAFQFDDLRQTFQSLEQQISYAMNQALPSDLTVLHWTKETDSLYVVQHIESGLLTDHNFYLAVKKPSQDLHWIEHFLSQTKIASYQSIHAVVGSAISALTLQHLQRTPSHLPIKGDYEYFLLVSHGEDWKEVVAQKSLALFVSYEFQNIETELWIIKE